MLLQIFWLLRLIPSSFCFKFWQIASLRLSSSSSLLMDGWGWLQLQLYIELQYTMDGQRYTRNHIAAYISSNTADIQALRPFFHRRDSADRPRRPLELLPRIEHERRQHISTDFKKEQDKSYLYRSEKRDKPNMEKREKLSMSRFVMGECEKEKKGEGEQLRRYWVSSRQGKRNYHEDRFLCRRLSNPFIRPRKQKFDLYAVFDGHGGAACAEFLRDHLAALLERSKLLQSNPQQALKDAFEKCEQRFLELSEQGGGREKSGSCAVACLVIGGKVVTANIGDSRALLLGTPGVAGLTIDHKPSEAGEKLRILQRGGKIYREQDNTFQQIKLFRHLRVLPGNLNVSRTIGDPQCKLRKYGGLPGMISPIPDVSSRDVSAFNLLLLGSDGLFEAFSNEQIEEFYRQSSDSQRQLGSDRFLKAFVQSLTEQAESKSSDNITVIGVTLN